MGKKSFPRSVTTKGPPRKAGAIRSNPFSTRSLLTVGEARQQAQERARSAEEAEHAVKAADGGEVVFRGRTCETKEGSQEEKATCSVAESLDDFEVGSAAGDERDHGDDPEGGGAKVNS